MIEFKMGRSRSGKKSRWSKKFPRKRILHRGDEKYCNWFKNNWSDDNYSYFKGDLHRFLISNIGRPVNKVFSEFLKRCDNSLASYSLKEEFYNYIKKKENIDWAGGFYVTNGILNYKKRRKKSFC